MRCVREKKISCVLPQNVACLLITLDLPRVQLRLGSTLDPDNIKEGDDVYFECSINAKPSIYKIVWKFNVSTQKGVKTIRQ